MRSVRAHADRLGADYGHFTGQRRWTEAQLAEAVRASSSWGEVVDRLGPRGGSAAALLKGHAARLGLDVSLLGARRPSDDVQTLRPNIRNPPRAGSLLAAAWFTLCGYEVSWPLEPCRYDLLVHGAGGMRRVQVKTTLAAKPVTRTVYLSTTRRERRTYDPDEIDDFFIIDGDLNFYLIPVSTVGGLHAIRLDAYEPYRLPRPGAGLECLTGIRRDK
ncbi:group I intron-associated PD-(D/E)XK endonuclease [Tessaracoccus caeni]|uniref:group I intron-associated PD-(D/E)XK endonuclease n=1 Tax=Tessaracoccus caeni TaxID=3031239 RepID=UPI0023DA1484|nr:group I intron-associated PD-(D/E)XK endonuclease [Tessaracoccus caeni]MDF1489996.1 group I intron-associated PD-(D/E)XK endonuclease [Tessaracoccus caeni]